MYCVLLVGCNNGGGGGIFSRIKRLVATLKVDRNTETVILQFFDLTSVVLETPELFTKTYFTHKPI